MQEKYHREELDLFGLTDFIKHYWKTLETGCSERLKGKWFNTLIFSATPLIHCTNSKSGVES